MQKSSLIQFCMYASSMCVYVCLCVCMYVCLHSYMCVCVCYNQIKAAIKGRQAAE